MQTRKMRLDEMTVGTRVEVTNLYTSDVQNGLVIRVDTSKKARFIDGKPVKSERVTEVIIAYNQGGELTLTGRNIGTYCVRKTK